MTKLDWVWGHVAAVGHDTATQGAFYTFKPRKIRGIIFRSLISRADSNPVPKLQENLFAIYGFHRTNRFPQFYALRKAPRCFM